MFVTRLVSGIVLIVIAILALGTGGPVLAAVLLAISMIAFKELTKTMKVAGTGDCGQETLAGDIPAKCKHSGFHLLEMIGLIGIVLYYAVIFFEGSEAMQLMCIVGVFMAMMFAYVTVFPKIRIEQVVASFFAFMYAPVMLSFVYLTRMNHQGIYIVWMILISSWGCDTCAYAVGMLIGKKKIFPVLSPKKSLEGCIGGVLGSALLGAIYGHLFVEVAFPNQTVVWIVAFICAASSVISQVGDLAASGIKRNYEVKDYGKLIPGHGGIMDRFDSVIVTAPMIYFLTSMMIKF